MKRWIDPQSVTVPPALADAVGGHPLVAQTLVRRGFTTVDAARAFLDPDAYVPSSSDDLPGLSRAVQRITDAVRDEVLICVWGDFDVDGQTSTTLLVETLRDLGAKVVYHIPVRETESHGIRIPALQEVLDQGVRLILTCDTGIDAHEAVDYANARGVDVVITDHHELPPALPQAHAIVNPHLLPDDHPLASLPGVGVAYKLAEALYAQAGRAGAAAKHLDLVALGIVADVAVQAGDARYLLQRGLEVLRNTQRPGLQELIKLARINPARLTAEHIGFGIAPRLNALGRLSDANAIVEFFTTTNLTQARILASELEALNDRRKLLSDQVFAAAQSQIAQDPTLLAHAALVLEGAGWPVGVIGIVANRLVELYQRPAILIATSPEEVGRGSARSVEGCHITEALATQQDLLMSFGGHAMAAGLGIAPENIAAFRRGLSRAIVAQTGEALPQPKLYIDGYVALNDLSLNLVDELERLAPFGSGNPPLILATHDVHITATRALGRDGRHLLLTIEAGDGVQQQIVWWRWNDAPLPEGTFDLAYTVRANDFRGQRELQVVWEDAREEEKVVQAVVPQRPKLEIVDYRREPHPLTLLTPLLTLDNVQIWREGPDAIDVPGSGRNELTASANLVIWTLPPGPDVLYAVLEAVSPRRIYLFNTTSNLDHLEPFLKFVAGAVKYAIMHDAGRVMVSRLAARVANRESSVRLAIAWLEAQGHVTIVGEEDDIVVVQADGEKQLTQADAIKVQLGVLLAEVAAYRVYFSRADLGLLDVILAENGV